MTVLTHPSSKGLSWQKLISKKPQEKKKITTLGILAASVLFSHGLGKSVFFNTSVVKQKRLNHWPGRTPRQGLSPQAGPGPGPGSPGPFSSPPDPAVI